HIGKALCRLRSYSDWEPIGREALSGWFEFREL
ncbi:unnamed protein product, partial [marine sediment metagenome]